MATSSANAFLPVVPARFLTGNLKTIDIKGQAPIKTWHKLYERYGPAYEVTIPFRRMHIVDHPIYLEHIQKTNHKNYVRGEFKRDVSGDLHRGGIFIADGADWQFQRKAATKAFSKQNFEQHITITLHYWLDIFTKLLSNLAKEKKSFDFQEAAQRLMFCLFLRIAFHEDDLAKQVLSEDPKCLESIPEFISAFDLATPSRTAACSKNPAYRSQLSSDDDVASCGDSPSE